MSTETKITILGSGTSTGVPVISCQCAVCTSGESKNIRTRSSLFLQSENTSILIDSGPDLREQLLRENITHADAVLYTHGHADHTVGMDDLRAFCWRREDRLPLYASADTLKILTAMFPWAFDVNYGGRGYIRATGVELPEQFQVGDFTITPFPVEHASIATHGFLIELPSGKKLAYASDIKRLPADQYALVAEADLHIFDALRIEDHPSHMTLAEACALTDELGSQKSYFTHLSCFIDYHRTPLPPNRHFAYDGLSLML